MLRTENRPMIFLTWGRSSNKLTGDITDRNEKSTDFRGWVLSPDQVHESRKYPSQPWMHCSMCPQTRSPPNHRSIYKLCDYYNLKRRSIRLQSHSLTVGCIRRHLFANIRTEMWHNRRYDEEASTIFPVIINVGSVDDIIVKWFLGSDRARLFALFEFVPYSFHPYLIHLYFW